MADKSKYCHGCHDDFYNGNNDLGVKKCMHMAKAKVVWKEAYYHPNQVKPTRIRTLSCFKPRH